MKRLAIAVLLLTALASVMVVLALAALALLPAAPARAQGNHVELAATVPGVGKVVLSFDLPAEYVVVDEERNIAWAEGPAVTYPWGPELAYLGMWAVGHSSSGMPRETAHEVVAEELGDTAGPILAEGPLTVGEFEGYTLRVRSHVQAGEFEVYRTALFVVVRVAENGYVWLQAGGDAEPEGLELFLESGESLAQEQQRVFDAIVGSLTVSAPPPVEEPTPEPARPEPPTLEPVQPTAVVPEGERVELEPLELDGYDIRLSFAVPSGYTVVDRSETGLTLEGPEFQYGPSVQPVRFLAFFGIRERPALPQEVAREYAHDIGEHSFVRIEGFHDYVTTAEGSLGEDGYFVQVATVWEEGGERYVGQLMGLVVLVRLDEQHYAVLDIGHTQIALDASFEPHLVAGTPYPEVRQAIFDSVVGSLRVSVSRADVGAPQTEFVGSVPGPDEISTDPEVIGSNIFLALFVILAFAFTSTLFNQTLDENRREIEGWVRRFFTPFRRLTSLVEQRYGVVAERWPWVQRVVGPAVILLLTGLIYGFLSPDFGFNTKSVVLFVSVVVGVGAITYLYEGGQVLFTTGRFMLRAGVKLYALALVIAVGCVLLSRLVDFQPGLLYGFVGSYTLLAPVALDRRQSGQIVFFPAIALLGLSVIAWLLVIPLREVTQGSDVWWAALPEGAAVAVFVVGLQGLFFNMIPLSFMDGAKIAEWNRLLWFLMFGAAGFLFWHVLLNQEGAYLDALPEKRVIAALSLLAFYSITTLAIWAYFRGRVYGWAMPSMATVRGTVASWTRGAIERVPRIRWGRGSR